MIRKRFSSYFATGLTALAVVLPVGVAVRTAIDVQPAIAQAAAQGSRIVAMRRLSESQYRQTIADIFGPDITVAGRFEPVVRPVHEMIASGASDAAISPAGLEQFDSIARNIAVQVFSEKNRGRFVSCSVADPAKPDSACAQATLARLGRYLFRRPLTNAELATYTGIANDAAAKTGSFHKGVELALATMLVSPKFLYVVEAARSDPANPGALVLDDYSRASRLSFVLWNSTPNKALLDAAAAGKLSDPAQMNAIARRMIDSPRFEQGVRAFFTDMLLLEKFDEISKDPIVYPYFNKAVAQALPEQMLRTIVDHLVTRNGDYRQLFTTNRTFMTRELGGLYGVPVTRASGWEPYEFAPGDDRGGLLAQAGFLALYSHPGRSSPTLRGRAIRELLLCQPVPNPPGNVNFSVVQDTTNKEMPTARNRLQAHATDAVCAGCHKITDPIGLSLEQFDGIGAFRTMENGTPIDVSGTFESASFHGAGGLGKAIASSDQAAQCVTGRALEYATGKPPENPNLVEQLDKRFAANGYTIRSLFLQVATMPEAYQASIAPLQGQPNQISMATK